MSGLIVDNFAGGGGASTGIEAAMGRKVDIAINHNAEALAMHAANHPTTLHLCEDVFKVSPRELCAGRGVDLAWFSPDCRHHSKAKGGKPVNRKIRGLAWVAVRWAKEARPKVIVLENVEEFQQWGPVVDGRPDPKRRGQTFRKFVGQLRREGYEVEWRELVAADYGAPTTRKRLFLVARCDGKAIVWPEASHANPRKAVDLFSAGLVPWRTAAECIDWGLPCPSIFGRKRPLAEKTLRRVAAGLRRYVIECAAPFIVPVCHTQGGNGTVPVTEPLRTITTAKGGELALCVPTLVSTGYGEREGQAPRVPGLDKPLGTVVGEGKHALVAGFLAPLTHGGNPERSYSVEDPHRTVTAAHRGESSLVAAFLAKHYSGIVGQRMDQPIGTVTAVDHHSLVKAFLVKYYGNERGGLDVAEPMDTVTSKDRLGLVTVEGVDFAIVDIGLRMLTPRELARAQGFPDSTVLTGTKTSQVARIGNSVCPPLAEAIVRANCGPEPARKEEVA